jgi:acyl carrier protein
VDPPSGNFKGVKRTMITHRENAAETFQRVQRIVKRQFDVSSRTAKPCARLREDLGADSLDLVELVMTIAVEFGNEVLDEDFQDVQTVGEVAAYIDGKRTGLNEPGCA